MYRSRLLTAVLNSALLGIMFCGNALAGEPLFHERINSAITGDPAHHTSRCYSAAYFDTWLTDYTLREITFPYYSSPGQDGRSIAGLMVFNPIKSGKNGTEQDSMSSVSTEYPSVISGESSADSSMKKGRIVHGVLIVKDPTGAALRSLVIPGWGQLYTGHWFKALVYFGADAGMIYGIFRQNARYEENLEESRLQKNDNLRIEYERIADFYRDDRNRLIWWTAGLTLLSTFDAFVEAHLYGFKVDPTLGVTPKGDGPKAGIRITFP